MAYVLIAGHIVIQKQPYSGAGFMSAPDSVLCGYTYDGQTFSPPTPTPAPMPESISPRQFRQALTHFGYRSTVESAVAAADQDTKDWYAAASAFERHHPLVLSTAQALGYTSTQLDAVWLYGAGI